MPLQSSRPLFIDIIKIGSIWFMAMVSYYVFLPELGLKLSYNSTPYLSFVFFAFYIALTSYGISHIYLDISLPIEKRWRVYFFVFVIFAVILAAALRILELIPVLSTSLSAHPEIMFATPMYFLPKTAEVLLQHMLIITLVVALSKHIKSLVGIIVAYALIFGGAHIWLYFLTDSPTFYNLIITISALVSSLVFPYLITRVKSGFIYGFLIHLTFYITVALAFRMLPLML
jgi:hypothetical protein